jgi:hypothetical protein
MVERIVIFTERTREHSYDASTPEMFNRVALKILRERMADKRYRTPVQPQSIELICWEADRLILESSYEEIDKLPEPMRTRNRIFKQRLDEENELRCDAYEKEKTWFKAVSKLLALPDAEALKSVCSPTGKPENIELEATYLLKQRRRSRYEGYRFIHITPA